MPRKSGPTEKHIPATLQARENLDVHRVLSMLPLFAYHVVADIGCGPGYLSIPLGKHLFDGKLYAIDSRRKMLDAVDKDVKRINLTNVEMVLSKKDKIPLEDDSLDGAVKAFAMDEASGGNVLLQEAKRCLRKGGWLALLLWYDRDTSDGPALKDRADDVELRERAEEAGFRFAGRHTLNSRQYMLLMRA